MTSSSHWQLACPIYTISAAGLKLTNHNEIISYRVEQAAIYTLAGCCGSVQVDNLDEFNTCNIGITVLQINEKHAFGNRVDHFRAGDEYLYIKYRTPDDKNSAYGAYSNFYKQMGYGRKSNNFVSVHMASICDKSYVQFDDNTIKSVLVENWPKIANMIKGKVVIFIVTQAQMPMYKAMMSKYKMEPTFLRLAQNSNYPQNPPELNTFIWSDHDDFERF